MESMKQWFVVNTKPKNEDRAAGNFLNGGFDTLAPKIRYRKYRDGCMISQVEPMFPGYIFVKFHPVDDFRLVKYTRGVKTIVHFGERIVPISEEIIAFIKARLENGVATIRKRRLQKGDRIIVKEGPFKGLSGIFEKEMDGKERVAILLEGINYYARMEIDRDLIDSA